MHPFLPSDYFAPDRPHSETARRVISDVDRDLARRTSLPIGAYFTAVCSKDEDEEAVRKRPTATRRVLAVRGEEALVGMLDERELEYEILEHKRVRNIDDVRRELGVEADVLVKAILAIVRRESKVDELVVLVLQGSHRIDIEKVNATLGLKSARKWRFATQKEVKDVYGLEIGGVPPFGYDPEVPVFIDRQLLSQAQVVCGVGNPQRSLRLSTKDLLAVAGGKVADLTNR